jgi:hypothetical protein
MVMSQLLWSRSASGSQLSALSDTRLEAPRSVSLTDIISID